MESTAGTQTSQNDRYSTYHQSPSHFTSAWNCRFYLSIVVVDQNGIIIVWFSWFFEEKSIANRCFTLVMDCRHHDRKLVSFRNVPVTVMMIETCTKKKKIYVNPVR